MGANLPYIVVGFVICFIIRLVIFYTPPRHFPKNIPTIPFYYALIPLFKDVDQIDLYRKYLKEPLEKHGAVKVFFGGCWNILITRPSFVAEMFKHEEVYAKTGNQIKIPKSVLAQYTGDNIISSHGDNWRLYRSVIQPGLQQPDFNAKPIYNNVDDFVDLILEEQSKSPAKSMMPYQLIQRYTLENLSESLLGATIGTLRDPNSPLSRLQSQIKPLIFSPIFLNFPFLDLFPVPIRTHARKLAKTFTEQLCATYTKAHASHKHEPLSKDVTNLGCRLISAQQQSIMSESQFQHNMISVFLAGHENPQQALLSTLFVLSENPKLQDALREELNSLGPNPEPDYNALKQLPLLTSTIYEVLRMYPPISQLLNRRTTENIFLGTGDATIPIPANTYVGYNGYATHHDERYWPDADTFNPRRWGTTPEEIDHMFRARNAKSEFISFHGGRRACLGQKFGMFETRISLFRILRRVKVELDPGWKRKMTPAGPLYAKGLKLKFEEIAPRPVAESMVIVEKEEGKSEAAA